MFSPGEIEIKLNLISFYTSFSCDMTKVCVSRIILFPTLKSLTIAIISERVPRVKWSAG